MPFPDISPIAIQLGPIAVRWYALAYLAGVFAGAWYATTLLRRKDLWANDHPPFEPAAIWDFAFWAVIGIVLGGRIGYVLFYNLPYYSAHPNEIIALWDGGMSFHGGLVGIIAAMWLFTRSKGGNVLSSLDLLGAIGSIGLFLGRLANFVNGELYGAPTSLPWAVIFPTDPEALPRHPSQLYEAGLEGVVLFLVIMFGTRRLGWLHRPGLTGGVFGIGYALSRIVVEFVRLPDAQLGYLLGTGWLTMGQVLSLPVLAAGLALVVYAMSRPRA
ncbi:MAG: prolipoprotein diacylglyceryl transferase [Devosia sp. 67-54]|uniref:prolipoprotein diacylglyceryl transferase n=1 Tax=unclassified Devosia TaxID=196773 RepID=UPI00095F23B8|nr:MULTISPECIES: prolipoprotein diacylglyceryl transferase [unclassified Devosia]MBN9303663.1 prolipoprotein diacylglyceryl transferase [Devosia sp.]OJX17544.1 MAG: prolipoprotein diacylglyceryl transferase [Devosia sp. 67-54]